MAYSFSSAAAVAATPAVAASTATTIRYLYQAMDLDTSVLHRHS